MKAMARTNDHLCLANRPSTENRSAAAAGAGAGGPAFMAGTAGSGPAGGPAAGALPPRDRRRPSPPCPTAACSFRVEPSAPRSSASSFRPSGCLTPSAHPNNPDACIVARSTSSPFTTFSRAIVLLPRSGRGEKTAAARTLARRWRCRRAAAKFSKCDRPATFGPLAIGVTESAFRAPSNAIRQPTQCPI